MTDLGFLVAIGSNPGQAILEPGTAPEVQVLRRQIAEACHAWLMRSPCATPAPITPGTSTNSGNSPACRLTGRKPWTRFARTRSRLWRDHLVDAGLTNSSIRRKMTVLRSLFSYLQTYGYVGANPAHSDFVAAPPVPRDGKTVALTPEDCRRLLDAPKAGRPHADSGPPITLPSGVRDRALLAVLAYTGCRVGELTRLKVGSYRQNGVHRVLEIMGKGGKERLVPLHPEAAERVEEWLDVTGIRDDLSGPLFRPALSARGHGRDGFAPRPLTRRAVQKLVETYVARLQLDPNVSSIACASLPSQRPVRGEATLSISKTSPDMPTRGRLSPI